MAQLKTRLLLTLLTASLMRTTCFAQEPDSEKAGRLNSFKAGAWALQFQIGKILATSFQDFGISAKYHFSSKRAIRFGVGLSFSSSDYRSTTNSIQGDTVTRLNDVKSNADLQGFELASQYLAYTDPNAKVNLFFATGPHVRFLHNRRVSEDRINPYTRTEDQHVNQWIFGASGIIGAEWFFAKTVSLSGEYGISFEYARDHNTATYKDGIGTATEERNFTQNRFDINLATVKFGLSFYL